MADDDADMLVLLKRVQQAAPQIIRQAADMMGEGEPEADTAFLLAVASFTPAMLASARAAQKEGRSVYKATDEMKKNLMEAYQAMLDLFTPIFVAYTTNVSEEQALARQAMRQAKGATKN